jgi:hypothetical protein
MRSLPDSKSCKCPGNYPFPLSSYKKQFERGGKHYQILRFVSSSVEIPLNKNTGLL